MSASALCPGSIAPPSSAARAAAGDADPVKNCARAGGGVALVGVEVEVHRAPPENGAGLVGARFRRQAEHPLAEDVAQHLVGAAGDRQPGQVGLRALPGVVAVGRGRVDRLVAEQPHPGVGGEPARRRCRRACRRRPRARAGRPG